MVNGRHLISGYSALYDFSIDRSISKCGDRSGKSKFSKRSKIDLLHSEYRYADTRELGYKLDTIFDQIICSKIYDRKLLRKNYGKLSCTNFHKMNFIKICLQIFKAEFNGSSMTLQLPLWLQRRNHKPPGGHLDSSDQQGGQESALADRVAPQRRTWKFVWRRTALQTARLQILGAKFSRAKIL